MSYELTTTTELLDALRRGGDEPAWELFIKRYRPVLIGVACRLGLARDDAGDVAQQTLLELYRDFGKGGYDRDRGRLRSWVLGILRHRVLDLQRLRRREASRVEPGDPSPELLATYWQEQIDRCILEEAIELLRTRTKTSEQAMLAFELTVLRDVPPEAAARECGMTVNALYVARSRIAARLRELMAELEPVYDEGP